MENKSTKVKKNNKKKRGESSTIRKNAQVNLRIPEEDLNFFKKIAEREFIPCQTIITSILHKYVIGRYEEKSKQEPEEDQIRYRQKTG